MKRITVLTIAFAGALAACKGNTEPGVSARTMADGIHAVLEADRTVYTRMVVNRLQNEERLIRASEHWREEKALPLPAQMLRLGAELVQEKGVGFSYTLLSLWPINPQNAARTEAEKTGLKTVAENPSQPYYIEEELGGKRYLTAVYPDRAVVEACIVCHNNHKDTPKRDFKLADVMGGIVIRIPL